jgi:hypothetical protein
VRGLVVNGLGRSDTGTWMYRKRALRPFFVSEVMKT